MEEDYVSDEDTARQEVNATGECCAGKGGNLSTSLGSEQCTQVAGRKAGWRARNTQPHFRVRESPSKSLSQLNTTRSFQYTQSTTGRTPRSPGLNYKRPMTERFLKLQRDLRSAGFTIDSPPYGEDYILDSSEWVADSSPNDALDFSTLSPISAQFMEEETSRPAALPTLRYCASCRCEVVATVAYHKTWYDPLSLAGACLGGGLLDCFLPCCSAQVLACSRCARGLGEC